MLGRWKHAGLGLAALLVSVGLPWVGVSERAEATPAGLELGADASSGSGSVVRPGYQWAPVEAAPDPDAGALDRRFGSVAMALSERPKGTANVADPQGLAAAVHAIVTRVGGRAEVAVLARDLGTGEVLVEHRADEPQNPASNQKLLTAAAALEVLGPGYVFDTEVRRAGNDLYLRGSGDPSLDHDDLQAMAVLVAEQVDLAEIERLVVDDTAFSERRFGPGFDPQGVGVAYEAPSGALSVDFNTVEVRVVPVRGASRPRVELDAAGSHVVVINEARVGRRGSIDVQTEYDGTNTLVRVRGWMSPRARAVTVRRRIHDPGLHAGSVFAERLAAVTSSAPLPVTRGGTPLDADEVVVNQSAPLVEILDRGLAYSNNFIAEQVLRTTAWRVFEEPGDWTMGAEILEAYWSALGRGADDLVVENGSGLTHRGRLTAGGLVDLLTLAHRNADEGLLDTLPVAGEPGTLRGRLLRRGRGRVRAKTGTLRGISGLSGVITAPDGTPQVAFSILVHADEPHRMAAPARRRVEDRIVGAVLDALDSES